MLNIPCVNSTYFLPPLLPFLPLCFSLSIPLPHCIFSPFHHHFSCSTLYILFKILGAQELSTKSKYTNGSDTQHLVIIKRHTCLRCKSKGKKHCFRQVHTLQTLTLFLCLTYMMNAILRKISCKK